jgi:hypothetical protein
MSHYDDLNNQVKNAIDDVIKTLMLVGCTYPGALSLLAYQSMLRMETADEVRILQQTIEREVEQRESIIDDDDDDDDDDDEDSSHRVRSCRARRVGQDQTTLAGGGSN